MPGTMPGTMPGKPQLTGPQTLVFELLGGALQEFKGNERDAAYNVMMVLMESVLFSTALLSGGNEAILKQLFNNMGTQIAAANTEAQLQAVQLARAIRLTQKTQK